MEDLLHPWDALVLELVGEGRGGLFGVFRFWRVLVILHVIQFGPTRFEGALLISQFRDPGTASLGLDGPCFESLEISIDPLVDVPDFSVDTIQVPLAAGILLLDFVKAFSMAASSTVPSLSLLTMYSMSAVCRDRRSLSREVLRLHSPEAFPWSRRSRIRVDGCLRSSHLAAFFCMPAMTRSMIVARSNSAKTPSI